MLKVYISRHCSGCALAEQRVAWLRTVRPDVPIEVIDVDDRAAAVPSKIFGTPIYTWNDRIVFMGNPSAQELLQCFAGDHYGRRPGGVG